MSYTAKTVANAFLDLAKRNGRQLTNMQLQKLVYIAHGYSLAVLGKPLFSDEVQAWEYGPVVPILYKPLRKYGAGFVTEPVLTADSPVRQDSEEMSIIQSVWNAYGKYSGPQLSAITHAEGTPWNEIWEHNKHAVIPNDLIEQHYRHLLNERTKSGSHITR